MNIFELLLLAIGLSMDAFAVAICIGLTIKKISINKALIVGLYFGLFQAIMPLIGYLIAIQFAESIIQFGHWVVFGLLTFLGVKMIYGSLKDKSASENECSNDGIAEENTLKFTKMLPLAIATSIDALAVGVSFAFLDVHIVPALTIIGITTLIISMAGVKIGNVLGLKFKSKAELAGGLILVFMGVRVLIESLLG